MDRSDPGSVSDPSTLSLSSSFKAGEKRGCVGPLEESSVDPKRIKMRDVESVLRWQDQDTGSDYCLNILDNSYGKDIQLPDVETIMAAFCQEAQMEDTLGKGRNNLEWSNIVQATANEHLDKEEETSEIAVATASILADGQVTKGYKSHEQDDIGLNLCHAYCVPSSASLGSDAAPAYDKETSGSCPPQKADKECSHSTNTLIGLGLDLNARDVSTTVDHNPFHPHKKLGQLKSVDASECGSTAGPMEESEPLRRWKEMKQNGFLSSSHGHITMPKQQVCQPKKRKDGELKRKIDPAKTEQLNRFTKIAAPSGLLSKLNPGIINHVRNSKQVHSIIEAIVRSEILDGQTGTRLQDQMGRESKESSDSRKMHNSGQDLAVKQFTVGLNKPTILSSSGHASEICESEYDDDRLALKLSSSATMASENASSASNDGFPAKQDNISSLSLKAANIASQWLELLEQDIKGRLAALRRSKKRVRNVIQTELPYLISTEFSSNQENDPCIGYSSEAASSKKATLDMHVEQWKSCFCQMDKALFEEGKHLENWLRQVQEMHAHCEKGLRYVGLDGFLHLGSAEDPRLKSKEALEWECAVRAAAASIYSTCSLIKTTENVPCF